MAYRGFKGAALALASCLVLSTACGGDSEAADDDDSGGSSGSGGSGTGGSGTGGSGTGGSGTGGSSGGSGGGSGSGGSGGIPIGAGCEITPCGGDVTGTWNLEDVCVELLDNPFSTEPACADAFVGEVTNPSGYYTFNGGTVSWSITLTTSMTLTLDDACASAIAGGTVSAASVCPTLEMSLVDSGDFATATCTVSGALCECDAATAPSTEAGTDTYTISGNQFTDSDGDTGDFCVRGDTLAVQVTTDSGVSTLVLTR